MVLIYTKTKVDNPIHILHFEVKKLKIKELSVMNVTFHEFLIYFKVEGQT